MKILILVFCSLFAFGQEEFQESIVSVKDFTEFKGTGFSIDSHLIATCYHVTNELCAINIVTYDGDSTMGIVVMEDSCSDISVIYVPLMKFKPLLLSDCYPSFKDKVFVLGFPKGIPYVYSEGYVMKYPYDMDCVRGMLLDCPITYGSSGSPVFLDGKVIGIIEAFLYNFPTVSYAIDIQKLHDLIQNRKKP